MPDAPAILLVEDDGDLRAALNDSLELDGFAVTAAPDAEAALATLDRAVPDAAVVDIRMPGMDGLSLHRRLARERPGLPVILITGHGDVPMAVAAMRDGAFDFIEKPFDPDRLSRTLRRACQRVAQSEPRLAPLPLLGPSPIARRLRGDFEAILQAGRGCLIVGPAGAGQNRLIVHLCEPFEAAGRTVVRLNCANFPADLAPIELFGPEGAFARAGSGIVVLEAFSVLDGKSRAGVLSRLDRAGSGDPSLIVTVATAAQAEADLGERFAGRRLDLPPLAKRREDVAPIFLAFVRAAAERFGRAVPPGPVGLEAWLGKQRFEGNVAEVQALAERFVLGAHALAGQADAPRLSERVNAYEKVIIEAELARHGGRIRPTYEALGVSRKGLYDKMKRYGIDAGDV